MNPTFHMLNPTRLPNEPVSWVVTVFLPIGVSGEEGLPHHLAAWQAKVVWLASSVSTPACFRDGASFLAAA